MCVCVCFSRPIARYVLILLVSFVRSSRAGQLTVLCSLTVQLGVSRYCLRLPYDFERNKTNERMNGYSLSARIPIVAMHRLPATLRCRCACSIVTVVATSSNYRDISASWSAATSSSSSSASLLVWMIQQLRAGSVLASGVAIGWAGWAKSSGRRVQGPRVPGTNFF